jgi:hypothetical protein
MILGVFLYRPIFNTFLKDADTKAWRTAEGQTALTEANAEVVKIDTLENQLVVHNKKKYSLPDGRKWGETSADTIPAGQGVAGIKLGSISLGAFEGMKAAVKPVVSDKVLSSSLKWKFVFLIWVMIIFVTMAYAPIAAFLVELFPTKIRYTSMSLPYHIGNGVFGGLVPFIATLLSTSFANDPLVGLWYPVSVAALCFIIGAVYLQQ